MDMFEAYDKYIKPEDDAAAAALAEAAKKEAENLWDDHQPSTEEKKVVDQPGVQDTNVSRETSTAPTLSDTDIDAIAKRLAEIMGQKGGTNDGSDGNS